MASNETRFSNTPNQYLEGSPVDRLVFSCLLVAGLLVLLGRMRQVQNFLRANTPILLFFGYCGVSTLWSDYPDVAFKRWIKALGDLVMVMIVLTDSQPTAALKRFIGRAGFLLLPVSILLIKYYSTLGRAYDQWTGQLIVVGVTTNKNTLGLTVLLCGIGAVWRVLEEYRIGDKQDRRRHLIAQGILLSMAPLALGDSPFGHLHGLLPHGERSARNHLLAGARPESCSRTPVGASDSGPSIVCAVF